MSSVVGQSALSASQRSHLLHLYRRILRTSQVTFANDQATYQAWRSFAAAQFRAADPDPAKYEEHVKHAQEVEDTLRRNVVQGQWRDDTGAYSLRIRPDTELGSNETIKQNRNKQIADLKISKRPTFSCSSASASASSSASASRSFSSSAHSSSASSSSSSSNRPIPRPIPIFPSLTILADGSSILLQTTSPRHTAKLTRDPTNHPLWNPAMADRRLGGAGGSGDGEDGNEGVSGRLGRFRKRFDTGVMASAAAAAPGAAPSKPAPASATSVASAKAAGGKKKDQTASSSSSSSSKADAASTPAADSDAAATQEAAATSRRRAASFDMDDLDWMSVGGRQARPGSEPVSKKGGKGKK
ncbi:hypothetical protein OC846_001490 [Tilletia horrida]|uniref:Mitochondrial zinc maintenance protein 1, mitochondrial n=1 Tax=Tilletia horrida TaxID=155126 RepID=A0AAN6GTY3_9BASI|nr:hypothetical protein OC845_001451 [Tilletia horrida]KAK0555938.1 hypothetical protein OC846_001490 [Tilletia horrida]KAK0568826.1 hypothetical protein OC861_001519 [Tilletia horrida]